MGQEDAQTEKSKPCHCSLLKHSSFQEGLLDIEVEFSDGTTTPLKAIDPAHYYLTVDSLNPHVIAFAPVAGSTDPRVIAVGRGQGKSLTMVHFMKAGSALKICHPRLGVQVSFYN